MVFHITVIVVSIFSLAIAMLIDSAAWHIRAMSLSQERGLFISKTNIFLYGGRFFSLLYMTGLSFLVDIGKQPSEVVLLCAVGFVVAAVVNHILLGIRSNRKAFMRLSARCLFLPRREAPAGRPAIAIILHDAASRRLFILSTIATFVFSMGISVPYIIAAVFPDFRMTFNNLGQIINSIGMLIILLLVDAKMYKDWDDDKLAETNEAYTLSRSTGLISAGMIFALAFLNLGAA
jgi:Alternate to MurJ